VVDWNEKIAEFCSLWERKDATNRRHKPACLFDYCLYRLLGRRPFIRHEDKVVMVEELHINLAVTLRGKSHKYLEAYKTTLE
jgi:hypothetical protein